MKEKIREYIIEQLSSNDNNKVKLIKEELKTIGGKYVTDGFRIGYLIGAVVAYDLKCYYILLNKDVQIVFILCDQEISVLEEAANLEDFKQLKCMVEKKPYDLRESVELEMSTLADIFITPLYIGNKKMFLPKQTILSHNGDEVVARLKEITNKEGSEKLQQHLQERKSKREFIQNEKRKIMDTMTKHAYVGDGDIIDIAEETEQDESYKLLQLKYIHLLADFDNYKKRTAKEKEDIQKTANEKLLLGIIELVDDMERGLEYSQDEGLTMIYNKFKKFLSNNKVREIPTNGEMYDCEFHEAVGIVECGQNGKIIQTTEKGYFLQDKVLRYAKVIIGN